MTSCERYVSLTFVRLSSLLICRISRTLKNLIGRFLELGVMEKTRSLARPSDAETPPRRFLYVGSDSLLLVVYAALCLMI